MPCAAPITANCTGVSGLAIAPVPKPFEKAAPSPAACFLPYRLTPGNSIRIGFTLR
jgi:hypothetical protein